MVMYRRAALPPDRNTKYFSWIRQDSNIVANPLGRVAT